MKDHSYGVCVYKKNKHNIQILLLQPVGSNEWGFIKGKIEENEHPKECAVRECFEETGIILSPLDLDLLFFRKTKRKNIGIYMIPKEYTDMSNIKLCPKEAKDLKWFDLYGDIDIHNNQKLIIEDIKNYCKKGIK